MAEISLKKRIWGWMAFDWATQPFYTLGLTFIFGPYFAAVSLGYFETTTDDPKAARAASQALWFWGSTIAGLFIAFTAPLIGAYADSTGRRMPWVWMFSAIYFAMTWALWWTFPDASTLFIILIAFNVGLIASEFMLIFVNAILPSLGDKDEVGKISGNGAALGYWGGVVSLFIMLLLFAENESGKTLIGLDPVLGLDAGAREGTRSVGPFIAIWFAVFMIPFFLWVREPKQANRTGGISDAMADLKQSLKGALKRRSLLNFLVSSMFYRDALNALYSAGGVYATLILGWSIIQIGVFGIVGAITAAVATQIGGIFDSRLGPKPVIKFCCFVLIAVTLVIVGMNRISLFGVIALSEGSALPDIIFYICGAAIGGAGGAIYAASRSMMVRHTHPERPTEAFGLFALSGKATAFLAPMMIALFSTMTGSAQLGYIPVIALFVLGLWLLRYVNPEGDHAKWSKSAVPVP
ncbi:MFS transporter [Tateyamaria omphalii]|uniref:MFS transporter n=1 Tax=Tateyamaria omphalii TaxID=299262 RepID=UPI001C9981AF|nr:MFS transporter [Tateyamaria omphalii]MBY5933657.1 MFS transporter [Tateyamaria omphalii]